MLATQHIQLLQYKNYTNANTTTTKHSSRFYKKKLKSYTCTLHNDKYAQVHRVSKKLCQCYFVNNSVKHWPTLIIFGKQHREKT